MAVFGSSRTDPTSDDWKQAEDVGHRLASAGITVITGGYGGTMEAVSKGASESGGRVVGVTSPTLFPGRTGANAYVGELIEAENLPARIGTMLERADGVIALSGSIGTAAELLMAWNHNYLSRHNGGRVIPTVAVGDEWRALTETMIDRAGAEPGDIHLMDRPDLAVEWILGAL